MRVIWDREPGGARVLALGTFDGVHKGHQALLDAGKQYARKHGILLRACSFDRHPLEVLRPEIAPKLLTTLPEKICLMARYGADELQLLRFSRETADMEPGDFLGMLRERVRLKAVVAGWNYTFGKGGKGDADLLREDGRRFGYDVLIVPPVRTEEGEAISSTLIRGLLEEGRMEEAAVLMGHPYELRGRVTDGNHPGNRNGVPTVCIRMNPRKQLPASGVYPCRLTTAEGDYSSALLIGTQPAPISGKVAVEAQMPDTGHELYGQAVRLIPGNRIRQEQEPGSAGEPAAQVRKDQEAAL